MSQQRLRAAVVQQEAVHEEVVPSVFHALLANDLEPTAFLNKRIRARSDLFSAFTSYADRVDYVDFEGPADREAMAAVAKQFDLLVMNTFQRDHHAALVSMAGVPTVGVVHNPLMLLESPACLDLIRSGQVVPVTLAPHVTEWMMAHDQRLFANTRTIATWMWDMPAGVDLTSGPRRRITIPGAVEFYNRDYAAVLDALPALVDEHGYGSFDIAIVGGGSDRAKLEEMVAARGLEEVFWFAPLDAETGFVPTEVFFAELARSSFLLPLLPESRRDYRAWKITLAISNSIGFNVPAIVDRWTALVYDLPSVDYPAGQLARGLTRALTMSDTEVEQLRADLSRHRSKVVESSTAEMGRAVQGALAWQTPSIGPAAANHDDREAFLGFAAQTLPASYSQRFQDLFAWWESGGSSAGFFVEFGALNGKDFSNTFLLERLGWRGVVAEPHPDYLDQVRKNRACHISTKCVYDKSGETVVFRAVKGRPALSSIDGFGTEDEHSVAREDYDALKVETITLEDLLVEAGAPSEIDFLSIDTEGSELRILQAFDFDRFRIRCISVEHNEHQRDALHALLTSKGYVRKWEDLSGHDDWYVHSSAYPDWRQPDVETTRVSRVRPYRNAYAQRRDMLVGFLDEDAPRPPVTPDRVGGVRRVSSGGSNSRWSGVDAGIDYGFLRGYLDALAEQAGMTPDDVARRVDRAFLRLCCRMQPTLAVDVGARDDVFTSKLRSAVAGCRVVSEIEPSGIGEHSVVRLAVGGDTAEVLNGAQESLRNAAAVQVAVGSDPERDGSWVDTDVVSFFKELGHTLVMMDETSLVFVRNDLARKPWVSKLAARVYRGTQRPSPREAAPRTERLSRRVRRRLTAGRGSPEESETSAPPRRRRRREPVASTFDFEGVGYTFFVANPDDAIQKEHVAGRLFDYPELVEMSRHISDGDLVLDVGSNVGNHAVYFSKRYPQSRIMVFEPSTEAARLLRLNLAANHCENVDTTYIGVGLSDRAGTAVLRRGGPRNLGGSRIADPQDVVGAQGRGRAQEIRLLTGDEALEGAAPAFIKIDVEGHEFEALEGLSETIRRHRPRLFVEVNNANEERLQAWLSEHSYTVAWEDRHYAKVTNYLMLPAEQSTTE
ncbi:MAG TPA: FkbM family methyltransferase [Nocardioidaceae bacterium]|nr:FkbM family methyltransferase [Nocardioidaceae bacterium]